MGGFEQPADMLPQAKKGGAAVLAVVSPDTLEYSQSVMQSMGHDVHLGLGPGDEFAVQPDILALLYHPPVLLRSIWKFYCFPGRLSNGFPRISLPPGLLFRYDKPGRLAIFITSHFKTIGFRGTRAVPPIKGGDAGPFLPANRGCPLEESVHHGFTLKSRGYWRRLSGPLPR